MWKELLFEILFFLFGVAIGFVMGLRKNPKNLGKNRWTTKF